MTQSPEIQRVDLGDGRWADLRALRTLRHRDRRAYSAATGDAVSDDGKLGGVLVAGIDAGIALLVVGWNVTGDDGQVLPLPKDDPSVLDDLDLEASAVLSEHAQQVAEALMGRKLTPKDPSPDSPTVPSSD